MNKLQLNDNIKGHTRVRAVDVAHLARIAHNLRQEIGDPRLPGYVVRNYSEIIKSADEMIEHAGGDTNADA